MDYKNIHEVLAELNEDGISNSTAAGEASHAEGNGNRIDASYASSDSDSRDGGDDMEDDVGVDDAALAA